MPNTDPEWVTFDPNCSILRARYWSVGGYLQVTLRDGSDFSDDDLPSVFFDVPPWVGAAFSSKEHSDLAELTIAVWARVKGARPKSGDADDQAAINRLLNQIRD